MAKFKTRARAVDMLGRQQIAGVANAISELFKNAYDAYADNVVVDYFHSDGLFILRDDGVGMTEQDFLERWLTLGTESKVAGKKGIERPYKDKNKKARIILGEKGIGRLAIAIVGPQVLVLSRAQRGDGLKDLVAAFVHWGLFEAPGVNLEDIEIPVRSFPGGEIPTPNQISDMIDLVHRNTQDLERSGKIESEFAKEILADLNRFPNNIQEIEKAIALPSLTKKGRGTHFYILPSNQTIKDDLSSDMDIKSDELSQLSKLLIGFANTMSPGKVKIPIKAKVNYWKTDDSPITLISENDFWTDEDLEKADHRITGSFDASGQFVGAVRIYGETFENHVIPAPNGIGLTPICGPFEIDFGYVMGRQTQSGLSLDDFAMYKRKLQRIGGLYVYKDGIRILPYGDADVDYLEIEKRRNKGAGYYFFSYRRLFGVIRLSNRKNIELIEKAGREGFQNNKAYREFRQILINFFLQLAADFFRSDYYEEKKGEMARSKKAREEQKKQADKKRREFENAINIFFDKINNGQPTADVDNIINNLERDVKTAIQSTSEPLLNRAEMDAMSGINSLRDSYRIQEPGGFGLTRDLKRDWLNHQAELQKLEEIVFSLTEKKIASIIDNAAGEMKVKIDEGKRIERLLNETVADTKSNIEEKINLVRIELAKFQKKMEEFFSQARDEINDEIFSIEKEIRSFDLSDAEREIIHEHRRNWEEEIRKISRNYDAILSHILTQLDNIKWYRDEDGYLIGDAEITAALEEEVLDLQETVDLSLEAAQLGKAIEVISHEFNLSIATVRENIGRLRNWAAINPELSPIYNNIRTSFDNLDGYLKLFTPLQRRLQRSRTEITGAEIYNYLFRLFGERLEREEINFQGTETFKDSKIYGFRSTFIPVFINLIDNAIFWTRDQKGPKKIVLDVEGKNLLVSDTGPGIAKRDRDTIFERGFTRKPGGSGLGLFLSREALREEGYEIILSDQNQSSGATFVIRKEE